MCVHVFIMPSFVHACNIVCVVCVVQWYVIFYLSCAVVCYNYAFNFFSLILKPINYNVRLLIFSLTLKLKTLKLNLSIWTPLYQASPIVQLHACS